MKVEGYIFALGAALYVFLGGLYWYLGHEPVGTTALALTAGMAFLIAFYVLFTGRQVDPRPEDFEDTEVADFAGEYGFFSPTSWWPLPVGFFAAVTGTGLIVGWWLLFLGFLGLILSLVGLVFEYYRGEAASL
ncbi:unannotated protein [freshwater metagenome]|uniref:Unannotated protein n=1 Tax=freshwater metagenome TaxID=449393 RepID=A0A6J7E9V3_9ZZZZ|nr:cytochrome c oxidase subunit 4 [Actinomycetota bacterium]